MGTVDFSSGLLNSYKTQKWDGKKDQAMRLKADTKEFLGNFFY